MIVLVTGCRSGVGRAAALTIAEAGHEVYAGFRRIETSDEFVHAARGLPVTPVQLDVTRPEECQDVIQRIREEKGRLDGLVNNAGLAIGGFLEELAEDELRRVFEVNVFGVWNVTRASLPMMRAQRHGRIVNISSMSGRMGAPAIGAYCASKFALEGLSESWRHELAPFGIQVGLLELGAYRSAMIDPQTRSMARGTANEDSPYRPYLQAFLRWYDERVVRRADDPRLAGREILKLLTKRRVAIRSRLGRGTGLRSFALQFLPFWVIERAIAKILGWRRG